MIREGKQRGASYMCVVWPSSIASLRERRVPSSSRPLASTRSRNLKISRDYSGLKLDPNWTPEAGLAWTPEGPIFHDEQQMVRIAWAGFKVEMCVEALRVVVLGVD
jgi:hypothetical protein